MAKHTQTNPRQIADELFELFDHFVKLALKGLRVIGVICQELSTVDDDFLKKICNINEYLLELILRSFSRKC